MDPRTDTRRRPPPARNPSLDHPDLQAMRRADAAGTARFNARLWRRLRLYVLGSVICFPLVTALLTSAGFSAMYFQIPVAAAYGVFVAYWQPTGFLSAAAAIAAGLFTLFLTGHLYLGYGLVLSVALYGLIGAMVGIGEYSKMMDGK